MFAELLEDRINPASSLDFSGGFAGAASQLTLNGFATINGSAVQLTDGGFSEAGSVFSTNTLDISKFNTEFTFQLSPSSVATLLADGITFTVQNSAPTALGQGGGGMGYSTIGNSVAVKFDLFNNFGEGVDSTGLYTGGALPWTPAIDLTSTGIDLHSNDVFRTDIGYDGTTLNVLITDTNTGKSASQSYAINIPATVGSSSAFVGFTAGTGAGVAIQDIQTWTFAPGGIVNANIVKNSPDPTNAGTVSYGVNFSSAVSGVSASNFTLSGTGTTGSSITNVSGSGTAWTVTVNTGGDGTLGLNLNSWTGITDSTGTSVTTSQTVTGPQYSIDKTAPTSTITSQPSALTANPTASFTFSGADPLVNGVSSGINHFLTSLDGSAFTTHTSPESFTALAVGSHTFKVEAVDNAGNVGSPVSYSWTIAADTTPPTATITSQPPSTTLSIAASFSFTGTDPVDANGLASGINHFETSIDNAAFTTNTSPETFANLAVGQHTFKVRAVDNAGNISTPASYTWTIGVDTTPPTATITSQPTSPTIDTSATFSFTGTDPLDANGLASGLDHFLTSLDGSTFAVNTSPQSFTGLALGSHTFKVEAVDKAGNIGTPASYTWSIIVDNTPPIATITSQPTTFTLATSAVFQFTGTDPLGSNGAPPSGINHFETSIDGSAFSTNTSPATFNSLALGSHSFAVRAVDNKGNIGNPATYAWTIVADTTSPIATITSQPHIFSNATAAQFAFIGTDPLVKGLASGVNHFETSIDGSTFATNGSPAVFVGLVFGKHTFEVRAVDNAGNVGDPVSYSWIVGDDTTPPTVAITSHPATLTNGGSATFTFTATDPIGVAGQTASGIDHFEYLLDTYDATLFQPVTSPITFSGTAAASAVTTTGLTGTSFMSFTGLTDGDHVFQVRAIDEAGNVDLAVVSHWTVDATAPTAAITSEPPTFTRDSSATFTFSGTDPLVGGVSSGIDHLETSLDNAAFAAATSPETFTGLSSGNHVFQVRAVDKTGNVGSPVSYTWNYDGLAAAATITQSGPTTVNTAVIDFAVSFNTPIVGLTAANFTATGTTGATVASVSGSGQNWVVTVAAGADGSVGLQMTNSSGTTDSLGGDITNVPVDGPVVVVSRTPPKLVSITSAGPAPAGSTSITFNVNFSEPVTGVDASDFSMVGGTGTLSVSGSGPASVWQVTINHGSMNQNVQVELSAAGAIADGAGNPLDFKTPVISDEVAFKPAITPGDFAVGTDTGMPATVNLYRADGTIRWTQSVFGNSFTGGVRVAAADFNRDGVNDVVVGTGPGIATDVQVLDGVTHAVLFDIHPFEASFTGGVFISVGDVTGDGVPDLVISPDQGGGPRVRVFDGKTFNQIADFFGIADPNFRGGVRTAIGDVNGDGTGDLIVAAGFGGGPRVAGFDGTTLASGNPTRLFSDFFAFETTLRNGVYITAGDLNGDGNADLIFGGGPGGGPRVLALLGKALLSNQIVSLANFFAGDENNRGGVRVATKNLDGDGQADLIVGDGIGAGSHVTAYLGKNIANASGTPTADLSFDAFPGFTGGVFVG